MILQLNSLGNIDLDIDAEEGLGLGPIEEQPVKYSSELTAFLERKKAAKANNTPSPAPKDDNNKTILIVGGIAAALLLGVMILSNNNAEEKQSVGSVQPEESIPEGSQAKTIGSTGELAGEKTVTHRSKQKVTAHSK